MLIQGLYEQVISRALADVLNADQDHYIERLPIDSAEASRILSRYVMEIIERSLDQVRDHGGNLLDQVAVVNRIVTFLSDSIGEEKVDELSVDVGAQQLMALVRKQNSMTTINEKHTPIRPETSLAQSSLFTGSMHEPSMYTELKKEIGSADRIDMLVSFIKWSGLRLLIDDLAAFTDHGGHLRIITTAYMGATDIKAIEELARLKHTEIRVSYDTKRTRLHAKTYVFYRNTGFTTAYVGSSNLSHAAISSGLEWNVKMTAKDQPDTISKIDATFESYWHANEFEEYLPSDREHLQQALNAEKHLGETDISGFFFDIAPYPFQQEILDHLEAERIIRGHYKNLVVAATGTGKTVVSAFDYKRFVHGNQGASSRLLFVAHREEILRQSLSCFRAVLRDPNFGDLFVGKTRPENADHVFMSIQTFHSQEMDKKVSPDFYDYIIIDEFHHAAAPTYQKLLDYFSPSILLGLTATPERMDKKSILTYFDNRIAAEIRLPEAIDRKLLCPFQYFGVTDTADLDGLKWTRGGYDRAALTHIYSLDRVVAERRANMIISSICKYTTDISEVKGLGFCVSVEHACFMAEFFNLHNISAMSLTGESSDIDRKAASRKLAQGEVRFVFVVDIYNEGVDIPEINTVLFLRPTESLTVFLQQLGRGLRLSEGKECLTVLDFIGQANKKYNFSEKFSALLANTSHSISHEIKHGFSSLPKGCYISLERKAKEYILGNISGSFNTTAGILSRLETFEEDTGKAVSFASFAEYYHLDPRTILLRGAFSRLCVTAKIREDFAEPLESTLSRSLPRLCAIDSRRWIGFLVKTLPVIEQVCMTDLSENEMRLLQMFYYSVWPDAEKNHDLEALWDRFVMLKNSHVLFAEIMDLFRYNYDRIDFVDENVELGFACPLDLHCSYTRDQILVALDYDRPSTIREGVKFLPQKNVDVFFVTLNKSDKEYSPSTLYKDYSISESLFHWQSQSTTSEMSPTGQRYCNHKKLGSKILLFVREYKTDMAGAAPYTFLGLADYVSHEGSRPMNITWRLHQAIPAKFVKKTSKLIVG